MSKSLFRAKRIDNGEWLESESIIKFSDEEIYMPQKGEECRCIWDSTGNILQIKESIIYRIDSSTICKCTGKEYMNGEVAYEGDIYENPGCGITFVLKYGTYEAYCPADKCYMDGVGFYSEAVGYPQMPIGNLKDYGLKRGNIFDNPELLEVMKNE